MNLFTTNLLKGDDLIRIIQVNSNVKHITSGLEPSTEKLLEGEVALGKLTSDNNYHFFKRL